MRANVFSAFSIQESCRALVTLARSIKYAVLLIGFCLPTGFIAANAQAATPVGIDVFAAMQESTAASPKSTDIFLDASDADFDALSYSISSQPSHGTLSFITASTVRYTPEDDFDGVDSFAFTASDGVNISEPATVTISVFNTFRVVQLGEDIDGTFEGTELGSATALSSDGRTLAVAAERAREERGQVQVYRYTPDRWELVQSIDGNNTRDFFGASMSLSADGRTLAVGSKDSAENPGVFPTVYRDNGDTWAPLGPEVGVGSLANGIGGTFAGAAVSLSSDGNTVAISASSDTELNTIGRPINNVRRVLVFRFNGSAWDPLGSEIVGTSVQDRFASFPSSLALSGDGLTMVIGASGFIRVYRFDGADWVALGADILHDAAFIGNGRTLALSKDGLTVAVSGVSAVSGVEQVRVYRYDGSAWEPLGSDITGEADITNFGSATALSADGRTLAVGAPERTSSLDPGKVRLYELNGDDWALVTPAFEGDFPGDRAGDAVALSGDGRNLAIGAKRHSTGQSGGGNVGRVRVFSLKRKVSPIATDIFAATQKNTANDPQSAQVVLAASDADLDPVSYSIATGPANGSLGAISGSIVTYTPAENFVGADSFTYRANGGDASSDPATVTVTVFDENAIVPLGNDIDGAAPGDNFGQVVASAGDGRTIAIGSSTADDPAGPVRVYSYSDGSWSQIGDDVDSGAGSDGRSAGFALSNDGRTMAIGVTDQPGTSSPNYVRAYRYNGLAWVQVGMDVMSPEQSGDVDAIALSANGQRLALGSGQCNRVAQSGFTGCVFVFELDVDENSWRQLGNLVPGEFGGDSAGDAVALSSDGFTVAFSAQSNPGPDFMEGDVKTTTVGHTRVFRYDGNSWTQLGDDIDGVGDFDRSGDAIALSSDGLTVGIGTTAANNRNGNLRVFRFASASDSWIQRGADIESDLPSAGAGDAIAMSGDGLTVALGVPLLGFDPRQGFVQVYRYQSNDWVRVGVNDDTSGEQTSDRTGRAIALSSDGRTLVVGAPENDANGDNAGQTRVYRLSNDLPLIAGAPATTLVPGQTYEFIPVVSDADPEEQFTFSITNAPPWASFDTLTGRLAGVPTTDNTGTTQGIVLTVEDRAGGVSGLSPFDLTVLPDSDADGFADLADNCPGAANADQADLNNDGEGDVCDSDIDGDGAFNLSDAFPRDATETLDSDGDGLGDNREARLRTNPALADSDGDGFNDGDEVDAETNPLDARDIPTGGALNIILIKAAIDAGGSRSP